MLLRRTTLQESIYKKHMLYNHFGVVGKTRAVLWVVTRHLSGNGNQRLNEVKVKASKNPTLGDEPVSLWIEGLRPRQKVTFHASIRQPNEAIFECASHYIANEDGTVSIDHDESHGGSYTGIQPMAPFTFMTASPLNKRKFERFMVKDPQSPFTVDIRVLDSFLNEKNTSVLNKIHEVLPNLTLTRTYMAPGVQEYDIRQGRVRATLYLPSGDGPFPGIISMSGGYPGAMKYKAALLASHGFAALALKYFGEDDLPQEFFSVDLDYVEEAAVFLKNHTRVNGRKGVGIIANCYGATIGLALASLGPKDLIRSVASVSGWCFVYGNFTYKGKRVEKQLSPHIAISQTESGITEWKYSFPLDVSNYDPLQVAEDLCFPIHKRRDTSFLFVAGGEDGYLDQKDQQVAGFLEDLFLAADHPSSSVLYYPNAGHLIEHSFYPFNDIVWTMGKPHIVGGRQPFHAEAQIDSWPKILEFARSTLCT